MGWNKGVYEKRVVTGTVAAGTYTESYELYLKSNATFKSGWDVTGAITQTGNNTIVGNMKITGHQEMVVPASGYGLKIHSHLNTGEWANEFKGEFTATSGTMDGIAAHYHLKGTGTGVMRSILGVAYLDAGITLSGTLGTGSWLSGVLGSATVEGVLNGTAVTVTGTYGGLGACAGTLTACKYMSGLWGDTAQLTQAPSAGEVQCLLLSHSTGCTIGQAIYIAGPTYITNFLTIESAAGFATAGATVAGNPNVKLTCKFASTTFYLQGYDS